jgi:hypothetical protein
MTNTVTCDRFADLLSDFLERDVDEQTRARMEAHALACSDCGPLLADLRKLRIDSANMPELTPSRDLWSGIAARIETPVVELSSATRADGVPQHRTRRVSRVWIGLAAAGLVAITATVTHEVTKRSMADVPSKSVAPVAQTPQTVAPSAAPVNAPTAQPATTTAGNPAPTRSTGTGLSSLAANRKTAEQTYADEISQLRVVLARRRSQMDSTTVSIIEHNLAVIDTAITQCKQALRKDPNSQFLIESLNGALDNKVQLLRTAATLPVRS